MPIYEYQCQVCHNKFEVLQKLGEDVESLRCPKCGADELIKVFSIFSGGKSSHKSSPACSNKGFS